MKKLNSILWGAVLIAVGVLMALYAFDAVNFDLFFDGWWTLFLIVPCAIGLFTHKDKTGNLIGLILGVLLLLACQEILSFDLLWKLAVPALVIVLGLRLIFGTLLRSDRSQMVDLISRNGPNPRSVAAVFSGQDVSFGGEDFTGAELTAVFGGVTCDLRQARIDQNRLITATAVFGGVDILVPDNITVKLSSVSLFGGAECKKTSDDPNAVTLYVDCKCIFGGVDVK